MAATYQKPDDSLSTSRNEVTYYKLLDKASKSIPQDKLMKPNWIKMMIQRIESAQEIIENDKSAVLHPKVRDTLKNYCVQEDPDTKQKHLLVKKEDSELSWKAVPLSNTFKTVVKAHLATQHGGVNAMAVWLTNSRVVVASICLTTIVEMCTICIQKRKEQEDNIIEQSNEKFYVSGIIEILTMSDPNPNKNFDRLLIYQDNVTKFVQLRPISMAELSESTCNELLQLFSDISPPSTVIVPSELKDLFGQVVINLNKLFDIEIKLVTQNQLTKEEEGKKLKSRVKSAICKWLSEAKETSWNVGCYIVQWRLNNERGEGSNTPFELVFAQTNINQNPEDNVLKSIEVLNINRSKNDIDDFISSNPELEMVLN